MRLAHVINLYNCKQGSEAELVQRITIKTMKVAKAASIPAVTIDLCAALYEEDLNCLPTGFVATPLLERSIQDFVKSSDKRRLPIMHEILQKVTDLIDADYYIYTNADIHVYRDFYNFVTQCVAGGIDGMAINRVNLPSSINGKNLLADFSIEQLLDEKKIFPHPGVDCIVFARTTFQNWQASHICIGYPPVGAYLLDEVEKNCKNFKWLKYVKKTFHIGIEREELAEWKKWKDSPIWRFNHAELEKIRRFSQYCWDRHKFWTLKNKILWHAIWMVRRVFRF